MYALQTALGFTAEGVAAESVAAAIQSVVYEGNYFLFFCSALPLYAHVHNCPMHVFIIFAGETAGVFSVLQSAGALGINIGSRVAISIASGAAAGVSDWVYVNTN